MVLRCGTNGNITKWSYSGLLTLSTSVIYHGEAFRNDSLATYGSRVVRAYGPIQYNTTCAFLISDHP